MKRYMSEALENQGLKIKVVVEDAAALVEAHDILESVLQTRRDTCSHGLSAIQLREPTSLWLKSPLVAAICIPIPKSYHILCGS